MASFIEMAKGKKNEGYRSSKPGERVKVLGRMRNLLAIREAARTGVKPDAATRVSEAALDYYSLGGSPSNLLRAMKRLGGTVLTINDFAESILTPVLESKFGGDVMDAEIDMVSREVLVTLPSTMRGKFESLAKLTNYPVTVGKVENTYILHYKYESANKLPMIAVPCPSCGAALKESTEAGKQTCSECSFAGRAELPIRATLNKQEAMEIAQAIKKFNRGDVSLYTIQQVASSLFNGVKAEEVARRFAVTPRLVETVYKNLPSSMRVESLGMNEDHCPSCGGTMDREEGDNGEAHYKCMECDYEANSMNASEAGEAECPQCAGVVMAYDIKSDTHKCPTCGYIADSEEMANAAPGEQGGDEEETHSIYKKDCPPGQQWDPATNSCVASGNAEPFHAKAERFLKAMGRELNENVPGGGTAADASTGTTAGTNGAAGAVNTRQNGDRPAANNFNAAESILTVLVPEGTVDCPRCGTALSEADAMNSTDGKKDKVPGADANSFTADDKGPSSKGGATGKADDMMSDDGKKASCPGCSATVSYVADWKGPKSKSEAAVTGLMDGEEEICSCPDKCGMHPATNETLAVAPNAGGRAGEKFAGKMKPSHTVTMKVGDSTMDAGKLNVKADEKPQSISGARGAGDSSVEKGTGLNIDPDEKPQSTAGARKAGDSSGEKNTGLATDKGVKFPGVESCEVCGTNFNEADIVVQGEMGAKDTVRLTCESGHALHMQMAHNEATVFVKGTSAPAINKPSHSAGQTRQDTPEKAAAASEDDKGEAKKNKKETHCSPGESVKTPAGDGQVVTVYADSYDVKLADGGVRNFPDGQVKLVKKEETTDTNKDAGEPNPEKDVDAGLAQLKKDHLGGVHLESSMYICAKCGFRESQEVMAEHKGVCPMCGTVNETKEQDKDAGSPDPEQEPDWAGQEPDNGMNNKPGKSKSETLISLNGTPIEEVKAGYNPGESDLTRVNKELTKLGHGQITMKQLKLVYQMGSQQQNVRQIYRMVAGMGISRPSINVILGIDQDTGAGAFNV